MRVFARPPSRLSHSRYALRATRFARSLGRQVLANRETLLRVKAIQDANDKLAEEEVLTAIREAVGDMRALHDQAEADSKAAIRSLKELEGTVEREMARDERRRTVGIDHGRRELARLTLSLALRASLVRQVELLNNPDVAKLLQEAVDGGNGGNGGNGGDNAQSNGGNDRDK